MSRGWFTETTDVRRVAPTPPLACLDNEPDWRSQRPWTGWGQAFEQKSGRSRRSRDRITSGLPSFPYAASRGWGAPDCQAEPHPDGSWDIRGRPASESPDAPDGRADERRPRTIPPSRPMAGGWCTSRTRPAATKSMFVRSPCLEQAKSPSPPKAARGRCGRAMAADSITGPPAEPLSPSKRSGSRRSPLRVAVPPASSSREPTPQQASTRITTSGRAACCS